MKFAIGLTFVLVSFAAQASSLPSFACRFTEPFINIDTYSGGARFQTPESKVKAATVALQSNAPILMAITLPDARAFELSLSQKKGSDGMSDFVFPFEGGLELLGGNNVQIGGCIQFPDGTSPREVANLNESDTLNLRSGPGTKNAILTKLRLGTSVWAFPENAVKNWVHVAAPVYPANENGPIKVVEGWVNAKFLGKGVYAE